MNRDEMIDAIARLATGSHTGDDLITADMADQFGRDADAIRQAVDDRQLDSMLRLAGQFGKPDDEAKFAQRCRARLSAANTQVGRLSSNHDRDAGVNPPRSVLERISAAQRRRTGRRDSRITRRTGRLWIVGLAAAILAASTVGYLLMALRPDRNLDGYLARTGSAQSGDNSSVNDSDAFAKIAPTQDEPPIALHGPETASQPAAVSPREHVGPTEPLERVEPERSAALALEVPDITPPGEEAASESKAEGLVAGSPAVADPVAASPLPTVWARLIDARHGEWETEPSAEIAAPQSLNLLRGQARLELADGSVVRFQGPTELRLEAPRQLRVTRGQLLFKSGKDKPGKDMSNDAMPVIVTPVARFERPVHLSMQLRVDDGCGTEVFLDRGNVELVAARAESPGARWPLDYGALNQAVVGAGWEHVSRPAICMARGADNAFRGLVDVAGKPLEIDSPQAFVHLVAQLDRQNQVAPKDLVPQWEAFLARAAAGGHVASTEGVPRLADWLTQGLPAFGTGDAGFKIPPFAPGGGQQDFEFQGMININGQAFQFTSPSDFEALRRQLMGR